jgi:hypothetical protein
VDLSLAVALLAAGVIAVPIFRRIGLGAVGLTVALQLAVIYLPAANAAFKTQPLALSELALCLGGAAVLFHAVELEKWIRSKAHRDAPERAI